LANYGGGISIRGLTANITDLVCSLNYVNGSGGCIYFEAAPLVKGVVQQKLNLRTLLLTYNNASVGGGIRTINSHPSELNKSNCSLMGNVASLYGNDLASVASRMTFKLNNEV
jgi:hypothetical protein